MLTLSNPPMVTGKSVEELVTVRRYLFKLVEELNMSLSNISEGNISYQNNGSSGGSSLTEQEKQELSSTKDELKSLIIKNAKEVYSEIQELSHSLESKYVAISEFGEFRQKVNTDVSETADAVQRNIAATTELSGDFGEYKATTQGYIRQGIVGYDESAVPIIGIAIGQNVVSTEEGIGPDGKTYPIINTSNNMSIWTTEKLSFYIDGKEVAYFAGDELVINSGSVSADSINVGGNWQIDSGDIGFSIRYVTSSSAGGE